MVIIHRRTPRDKLHFSQLIYWCWKKIFAHSFRCHCWQCANLSYYRSTMRWGKTPPQSQRLHVLWGLLLLSEHQLCSPFHLTNPDFFSVFTRWSASSAYLTPITALQKCFQQVTTGPVRDPDGMCPNIVAS